MQCSGARPIRPPPSLGSLRVICSSSDLEGWLSWFPPRMSRAPPSDADKGSPFRNHELKEEYLLKLVDCEKRCRELQAQLSSLEREVPLLEDRLEKRRNEARLSDVALQKCIIAWNDLEMEENFWVATYGKSSKTWYKVDDDIDALRAEVGSLKDGRRALWTNVRQIQEEVKKCNEENRRLLKQLSKRRGDDEGAEAEHNSSADKGKRIRA